MSYVAFTHIYKGRTHPECKITHIAYVEDGPFNRTYFAACDGGTRTRPLVHSDNPDWPVFMLEGPPSCTECAIIYARDLGNF